MQHPDWRDCWLHRPMGSNLELLMTESQVEPKEEWIALEEASNASSAVSSANVEQTTWLSLRTNLSVPRLV